MAWCITLNTSQYLTACASKDLLSHSVQDWELNKDQYHIKKNKTTQYFTINNKSTDYLSCKRGFCSSMLHFILLFWFKDPQLYCYGRSIRRNAN